MSLGSDPGTAAEEASVSTRSGTVDPSDTGGSRVPARGLGAPFRWFWLGQSGSLIGDQITLVALPLLAVTYAAASDFEVALVATMLKLPFLFLGLPAGVWVTRWGLTRSMIGADSVRAAVLVILVVLVSVQDSLGLVVLVGAAAAIGSASVFFQICYQSLVPEIVDDATDWHRANLRLTLSESLGLLAGPALGGLLIGAWSLRVALAIDTVTYLASLVTLALMARAPGRRATSRPKAAVGGHPGMLTQIRVGFRYVRERPVLNGIMWVGAIFNVGVAMFETMLILYGIRTLGLGVHLMGLAVAAGGVGFPVGGLLSGLTNRRWGKGRTLAVAGLPSVAGIVLLGLVPSSHALAGVALALFTFGVGQVMFAVNAVTLRQEHSEGAMRAMATSVHRFTSWGALSVGTMLAGVVASQLGLRGVMLVAGAIAAGCLIPLFRRDILRA